MPSILVWVGRFGFMIYLLYLYFKPNPTMHDLVILGVNIYFETIFLQFNDLLNKLRAKIKK